MPSTQMYLLSQAYVDNNKEVHPGMSSFARGKGIQSGFRLAKVPVQPSSTESFQETAVKAWKRWSMMAVTIIYHFLPTFV